MKSLLTNISLRILYKKTLLSESCTRFCRSDPKSNSLYPIGTLIVDKFGVMSVVYFKCDDWYKNILKWRHKSLLYLSSIHLRSKVFCSRLLCQFLATYDEKKHSQAKPSKRTEKLGFLVIQFFLSISLFCVSFN